jgi:hypothetical protein
LPFSEIILQFRLFKINKNKEQEKQPFYKTAGFYYGLLLRQHSSAAIVMAQNFFIKKVHLLKK